MPHPIKPIEQVPCPENKGGGSHHLTRKQTREGSVVSCLTCKKTEEQLLDEALAEFYK